jgi:hypothetical protein
MFATNCDRLEIFADGTHLATATPDRRRFGHLAHPPAFAHLTMDGGTLPDLRVDGYTGTRLAAVLLMSADTCRGDRTAELASPQESHGRNGTLRYACDVR